MFLERPLTSISGADVVFVEAVLLPPPVDEAALESKTAPADTRPPIAQAPPPRLVSSQPARGLLDHGATSPERFGYLPFDQVDQAAEPVGDWAIDTDMLPRGVTLRVVLQLWISAAGAIDRWELVGDADSTTRARRALSDLARTPMQPAFRNQAPVASYRQLEIILQRD